MSTLLQRIGRILRKHREEQGYSQESFADHVGMHRNYYSAVERGEKNLQLDTFERLCAGLDVAMWETLKEAESAR